MGTADESRDGIVKRNHERFKEHWRQGILTEHFVANWIRVGGYKARVLPKKVAPTRADAPKYRDKGDIIVEVLVESKGLSCCFTGPDDWPYRERKDKFIVTAKYKFDRMDPKPICFACISSDNRFAAIVDTNTYPHWYVAKKTDTRMEGNLETDYYFCPMEYVRWLRLKPGTNPFNEFIRKGIL